MGRCTRDDVFQRCEDLSCACVHRGGLGILGKLVEVKGRLLTILVDPSKGPSDAANGYSVDT